MIWRTMPPRVLRYLFLLATAASIALPHAASAARDRWPRGDPPAFAPHSTANSRVTLEQAVQSVQRAVGGRVLDAREVSGGYRIKILTPRGEVRVVYVDAKTGAMR
jgi:uncharacterized membrane protein YkoI